MFNLSFKMSPEVLQLVYTVFINTINMVSTFWSGIKQNKKKKKPTESNKSSWLVSVYE